MALVVGLRLVGELVLDRGELVVGQAGDIAGEAGERRIRDRLEADRAGDVEAGGGRAVEEARVERHVDRLARRRRRLGGLQREIEPLGHIVLEQEFGVADALPLGIGVGVDRPFARRRVGEQRHGDGAAAEALVGDGQALVFDAVGALDDQRQRQAGLGLAASRRAAARRRTPSRPSDRRRARCRRRRRARSARRGRRRRGR